jgi:Zn-dependent peptidase ImmA (M78 family)
MKRLRRSPAEPSTLTTGEIVDTLLLESGVDCKLPTSQIVLLDFLGLKQLSFDFTNELEFVEDAETPLTNIRAALSLNDRLIAVQSNLSEKRTRFSVFHEIAHFVLPEHREKLFFLDDDETLSVWAKARLEREANKVAADLLFQGQRFSVEAQDKPLSIQTVLELAPRFGASYEAALRRFVEGQVVPCAVVVYDKTSRTSDDDPEDDPYKLQYTITSETFRRRFFARLTATPNRFTRAELYKPKLWGGIVKDELVLDGEGRDKMHFETELFSNGYKIFQLICKSLDV